MSKDVHEELQKSMQKAWQSYEPDAEDINVPAPDLAFLQDGSSKVIDPQEMNLDFLSGEKKHKRHISKVAKVAAILLAILVTSSGMAVFMNSDASYGVKGVFQNIKHYISPQEEPSMNEQGSLSLEVTDWEKLDEGKNVVPTLYIPQYIPKDYTFSKCTFFKSEGIASNFYEFTKGEETLLVTVDTYNGSTDIYLSGEEYKSPYSDKEIYVEKTDGEYTATYVDESIYIRVVSTISNEENVKVIEGVEPSK
ncbi:DUF4367 domain-containing protein [Ihubacter massiliensis]|uniref:DUF4367 domain-containing protein n=1 Tax=Hominibacterium faecale TaxID=2839743 RepID=A0A9J6QK15_9FIRM|nr:MULTISPECIES: DUF4367 domain-containing protein [Eubacteriales Family XIII. Incertae Sedis]MCO7120908.1 DUF4367 domain-containing protein [Ihubacter massiliensis]MCU7377824.1 DUF4367 domain-containing protein [Hominibacterium faecale]